MELRELTYIKGAYYRQSQRKSNKSEQIVFVLCNNVAADGSKATWRPGLFSRRPSTWYNNLNDLATLGQLWLYYKWSSKSDFVT